MLSFYDMACILDKAREKRVSEAIALSPDQKAASAKLAAAMRAKRAGAAPAVTNTPVPAQVEAPPAAGIADKIAAASAAQAEMPATSRVRTRRPRPTQGPSGVGDAGVDPNDPSVKKYGVRGSGGVGGNTNNLSGLANAAGGAKKGGNTVSKQMTDVPDANRTRVLLARLADKVHEFNGIIRNYPTMAFLARAAMAEFGYGPLKGLGANALEKFASDPNRSPESDAKLTKPFAFALQQGNFDKENKFGDLSDRETESVPKQYIPSPKVMARILKKCREFFSNAQSLQHMIPDAAKAAPAAPKPKMAGPSPDDLAAVQSAAGALPKAEAQDWMDVHNLMEHWRF